jgi:hypothetical protein
MKTIEIKENEAALVFDNEGGVTVICSEEYKNKDKLDLSSTTALLLTYLLQQKDLCDEIYRRAMEEADIMAGKYKGMVN